MSNLEIITELCNIVELFVEVTRGQSDALAQLGSVAMEEKRLEALDRYHALLGHDETPDEAGQEEEE